MSYTQEVKAELGAVEIKKKHCIAAQAFADRLFLGKKGVDKRSTINIELNTDESKAILERPCCKRCFLRTAFLHAGTVTDPASQYHFEIVCRDMETAGLVRRTASEFGPEGHILMRKGKYVFYIKDADDISDMLNICEAHRSLMEFENRRILKEVRNNVNRQVNCETANLKKTISAAGRQCEDILYLKECGEYDSLSPELKEVCDLRLDAPDMSLSELGDRLNHPISRSGLNHRFERIHSIAEEKRNQPSEE